MSEDRDVMVCLRVDEGNPVVPSQIRPCVRCGAGLWISESGIGEDFDFVCEPCIRVEGRALEIGITDTQRAYLREAFGYTDADIDRLLAVAQVLMNGPMPEEEA